ncbi:MAG: hypothetical protein K0R65_2748 [Crocinitomicaceae bacterium]|jgi:hypothetical protein|nr:hypothetical protein [Crocinitomicaceae bacterium]
MENGKLRMFLAGGILLLGLQSCKEIIATDISETVPVMILPQANDTVAENPVHFKWEEIEGATKYHLQVVSKSFSNIQSYAIDSMVTSESIFISLDSNEYELMLTAMNEGYSSHTLGPVKFWVGVEPNESSDVVTLVSPPDGAYFNEDYHEHEDFENGLFDWNALGNATYEFSLRKGTSYFAPTQIIEDKPDISGTQYTLINDLGEGQYHWGVRAYVNGGETTVSTRRFYIDTTTPVIPTLISPTGLEQLSTGTITFSWQNSNDTGIIKSPMYSVLEVADDTNFTNIIDSGTFSISNSSGTFTGTLDIFETGTFYWRVRNLDEAGNTSSFSTNGQFSIL